MHPVLADWWNPVTWLQALGGVLHGAFNTAAAVKNALGASLSIFSEVFRFFTDTGHFLADAVAWLTRSLFPSELQTWFFGTIGAPGAQWDSTQVYQNVFHAVQAPGIALAGTAAAARLVRGCVDHRLPAGHALLDVLPRFLVTVLVIGIPGTQVSLGYAVIVFGVDASMTCATALFGVLMHATLLQGVTPGEGWFTHIFQVVSNAGRSAVAVVVGAIPLLVLSLYAVFLMIVRTIIIGFCIVTAPLCAATLAFDGSNRFARWWSDLFIGALLTPIVFAIAIGLSVALASSIVSAAVIGPILAFVIMAGGLWFAGKMVHTITWRHFTHGGALAGFAAGVTTVLSPVHRLANAGFMAEALGANASGQSGAVNFMKRIGLASQGFNPLSGANDAMGAASGAATMRAGTAPSLHPNGGPPDIARSLSAPGRAAVSGAEANFSRSAFNAFAHAHQRLIGATTRDHPAGSVAHADRARVAWERLPDQQRTAFADDYLSMWLGSGTDTAPGEGDSAWNELAAHV